MADSGSRPTQDPHRCEFPNAAPGWTWSCPDCQSQWIARDAGPLDIRWEARPTQDTTAHEADYEFDGYEYRVCCSCGYFYRVCESQEVAETEFANHVDLSGVGRG